jgi:arylsulfatase A-like enzyme
MVASILPAPLRKPEPLATRRLSLSAISLAASWALSCLFLVDSTLARETENRRPNLIFIMADDLGYGDLGCYGQEVLRTPHIDKMRSEGMKFTDFYAGSTVCAPSRCVLMTGRHLGHAFIRGNGKDNLRPEDFTVGKLMKQAGYATGLFGKWGLGHEGSDGIPTRQGFDEFYGYLDQHHAHNYYPSFLIKNEQRVPLKNVVPNEGTYGQGVASEKIEYSVDLIGNELHSFLDAHHDQPFFIYYALTLPHANNEGRQDGLETTPEDLQVYADLEEMPLRHKQFAAMVSRVDTEVGRIIDKLRKYGIENNTLVIFTSDNGPHEEGGHKASVFNSSGPLRGTKRDLYEGGIRVPMIAWWPGTIAPGTESDHVAYFGDLMMTCAELTGTEPPDGVQFDSISFLPTLLGKEDQPRHEYLYWEFYEGKNAQAVRMGPWKGVVKPFGSENFELFNLNQDLGEKHDVAHENPKIVDKLKRMIAEAHVPNPRWTIRK